MGSVLDQSVYHSDDVPAQERFERWWNLVRETHAPVDLRSAYDRDFRAWQRVLPLDQLTIWPTTFQPALFRRTPRLIRASDPEGVHISVPMTGPLETRRGELETTHPPGTLLVLNASRPFDVWGGRQGHSHYGIGLEIPRSALPLPRNGLDRVAALPLSARSGYGALLAQTLVQIVDDTESYDATDGPRLASLLIEMVSALFATALGAQAVSRSAEDHRLVLLLRIKTFIQCHLGDPELRPPVVAAAHTISLSYLHRLFQQDGTSVSAWIRAQRLDRARRDLADRAQAAAPIAMIAARWGFRDAAEFSRAFRRAFGVPPREYRAAPWARPTGPDA
jgi:AraC-like DNA-binding protein